MDAIYLQIFVSFLLVVGSVLLFAYSARQRDDEHADRLALLPIEDEKTNPPNGGKESHVGSGNPR
ncbi:hypothetical protein WME95_48290 [Sorangium sp. So ce327]|jgi:hypothetical protein|uniref:cytochrome oxidase n=1 Tax=unclassified Sorangium TaxID=2621164 RepID=UPI003F5E9BF5